MRVECFYINLDRAAERRRAIEANFMITRMPGWKLTRFPAIDAEGIAALVPGSISASEKACFLSHRSLITEQRNAAKPYLIAEDDVAFGRASCSVIDALVPQLPPDFDICFTDLIVGSVRSMDGLYRLRLKMKAEGRVGLVDLNDMDFAGAIAYVVNPKSERLLTLLHRHARLDTAYDLVLASAVMNGELNAKVMFPFPTTGSNAPSQIQALDLEMDAVFTAFRQLVWNESNPRDYRKIIEALPSPDDSAAMFGRLIAAMGRTGLKWK